MWCERAAPGSTRLLRVTNAQLEPKLMKFRGLQRLREEVGEVLIGGNAVELLGHILFGPRQANGRGAFHIGELARNASANDPRRGVIVAQELVAYAALQ